MKLALIALVLVALTLSAGPALGAPPEERAPVSNPDLDAACGLDIHIILDESGSVSNYAASVRQAFNAFTSALNNTGSRIAVSDFSTVADLPLSGAARNSYTVVTDATRTSIFGPYITTGYRPSGSTNWEDGLRMGRYFLPRPSAQQPHLTVFITDGDPNEIIKNTVSPGDYATKVPLSTAQVQSQGDNNAAKDAAVPNANAIKGQGSHILAVAVGAGLNSAASLNRLIAVSGPNVFSGVGTFNIRTDDVYRVADFSQLEDALRDAAFQLCAPSVTVRKYVDLTPDPGTDDLVAASGWDMTATVNPVPAKWVLPATGAGATATQTTDASGFASFQWTTAGSTDSRVAITEEDPAAVAPGFVNDPNATACVVRSPDSPTDRPLPVTTILNGFTTTVTYQSIATCTMVNRALPAPGIDIQKATNGSDADAPPGPAVPIGGAVAWTYIVTNTGNDTLSTIAVTDNRGVAVTCPRTSLAPGAQMTCTANGVAAAGQYANVGSVTAVDPFGTGVNDTDPSHYFGTAPGIDIEKATNGFDADDPPGPYIAVGNAVAWTYVVRNTGNLALTNVAVADDRGVAVSCPATTLAPGVSMTCTGAGIAAGGQYENTATATGIANGVTVQDSDASHYFGENPSVQIVKLVNGVDANVPTGPLVRVGDPVGWTYEVTNTGNIDLTWSVTDSILGTPACPRLGPLRPGGAVMCQATAPATPGQYMNVGAVQGTSPSGAVVNDSDPAHYLGVQGGIELKKFTNGQDADIAPGPFVGVGAPVIWTYRVTNTGNGGLVDIVVRDLRGVAVSCPGSTLAAGTSMTCTATGSAQAGQYTNLATATASTEVGERVGDSDPSNYFGVAPGIHLEKSTNGDDADAAPGPSIRVGDPVTWVYTVYNTGNAPLTAIAVSDDRGVAVSCPAATLPVGAHMECIGTGTATRGQYQNTATAVATGPAGAQLRDSDPSHYFGVVSGIDVKKLTNGEDADTAPGPNITPGAPVTWTYVVANTGNIPITEVALVDDRGVVPTLVSGDTNGDGRLDPAETWIYSAAGVATAGQYQNTATVSGLDALEDPISSSDPSHYFGPPPVLALPTPPQPALPSPPPASEARPQVTVTKRAAHLRVRAGSVVRFTLRVHNNGTVVARRVRVCDRLPSGLAYASARGARIVGRNACFDAGTMRPRQTRTFAVSARADATPRSRRICNVAVRTASGLSARRARACVRVLPRVPPRPGGVTG